MRQAELMDGNGIGGDYLMQLSNRPYLSIRRSVKETLANAGVLIPATGYMSLETVSDKLSAAHVTDIDRVRCISTLAACSLFDSVGSENRLVRDRIRDGLAA